MVGINELEAYLSKMTCISRAIVIGSGEASRCIHIEVSLPELDEAITFDVVFDDWYPAKVCGRESIHFYNKELIAYPHIMEEGSLCLHTISSPDWREKLSSDIAQLCEWIQCYYIKKNTDLHFEHLIVNESLINDCYYSFNYAQVTVAFKNGEFGYVNYKPLSEGGKKGRVIKNYIATSYHLKRNRVPSHISPFSDLYSNSSQGLYAPYIVIDRIPGLYNKFLYSNYQEFELLVNQEQRKHIIDFSVYIKQSQKSNVFPLFIGYLVNNTQMAWNVAMIDIAELPTHGEPEKNNGKKNGVWLSIFNNQTIQWAVSNDISPDLFFGRGSLPKTIVEKRILIMGIGAIGSMVAQTLVRGGCREISLYDYDIKYPGNVCRSEYDFICPTNEKMNDLANQLQRISPYVNVGIYKEQFDEYVKVASQQSSTIKSEVGKVFHEKYDLIIDCTTDDDVMYALEQLNMPLDIVNISISNHANELVCAFSPSIFEFVKGVYAYRVINDPHDIFFPTGCWNPTFKATYNEIACKVQFALKKVISMLSGSMCKQNFIITEDSDGIHFQPW